MTEDDLTRCGIAARRHLDFLWTHPPTAISRLAVEAVIATASADPTATEAILRRSLEPERLRSHGAADLHSLCDAVPTLAIFAPDFVRDLYVTVMEYEEESTDLTDLSASAILPLTSTRRQDVDMAKWDLVRHFGAFLNRAPEHAAAALTRLVEDHSLLGAQVELTISGRSVVIAPDASDSWDDDRLSDDRDLPGLLNALEMYVAGLADDSAVAVFLDMLAASPRPAALWRRVLAAGAVADVVAQSLMPLDATVVALADTDLLDPLVRLVQARFVDRPRDERKRVEDAICAMEPAEDDDGSPEFYRSGYKYRLLLHALDPSAVTTESVRLNQTASSAPAPRRIRAVGSYQPFDDSADRYGLRLDTDADRALWTLVEAIKSFVDDHLNDPPADDAVQPSVEAVQRMLSAPDYLEASEHVREFADSTVARAAEVWTRRGRDIGPEVLTLAKTLLLAFKDHALPAPSNDNDTQDLVIIPQGPRTDAARGLVQVGRFPECIDDDVVQAVRALAADDVPWIRYSVLVGSPQWRETNPQVMWELLRHAADRESHDGVLRGVAGAAGRLRADLDDAVDLLDRVSQRVTNINHSRSALEACTEIAGLLWVLDGHAKAEAVLRRLSNIEQYGGSALMTMLHEVRSSGAFTSDDDGTRSRALQVCDQLVQRALDELGDLRNIQREVEGGQLATMKAAAEVLDAVASQLYFASGAFEARQAGIDHEPSPSEVRFADEAEAILRRLGQVPFPRVTHHLVQLLEHVLEARPDRVLLMIRDLVTTGGQDGAYQLDKMAVDLAVRIVQRVLADHRGILQTAECLSALRQILDVFVDAGWPEAHRLTYGLEHVFR